MSKFASLTLIAATALMGSPLRAWAVGTAIPDEVTHLRDPFKKPATIRKSAPKSDLELYSIDQFKLTAVMTGPKHLRAMVTLPNGKSYMVWENMRIGIRKGIVRRITPDAIHVREQVVNVLGQEENVDSDIRMESGSLIENSSTTVAGHGSGSDTLGTATNEPAARPATPTLVPANPPVINAGAGTAPASAPGSGSMAPGSSAPAASPPGDAGAAPGAPPTITAAPPTTGVVRSGGGG